MTSKKELVFVYDVPSVSWDDILKIHNTGFYLNFFDRVRILYWSKNGKKKPFSKKSGKFIFHPYFKPFSPGFFPGLKYMIWIGRTLLQVCNKVKNVTLVGIMPFRPGVPVLFAGKLKDKRTIVRLEAHKMEHLKWKERLSHRLPFLTWVKLFFLKAVYRLTLPFFDWVLCISEGIMKEAEKYGARKTAKLPVIVDVDRFFSEREETKRKEPVILFVGQIKRVKGLNLLVSALRRLQNEGLSFKFVVVGSPTDKEDQVFYKKLKQKSKGLDVEFRGWVSHRELASIYSSSDLLVLPSYSEGLGMVAIEAMASGVPVVATRTSGGKELVKDEETGFLVPVGDEGLLKEKIKILLKDRNLRRRMGRAGREEIKSFIKKAKEKEKKFWQTILNDEKK